LNFNGLHSIISQKTEPFINTAAKTPNPTACGTLSSRNIHDEKTIS
jgi:hypothetical protein